ncbi:isocitrate lyase/phosphoenolpyruvate mutase family protein [bacterium]|nr:MAG: isocitrate lyase/phosphoenolpyruvate mutase family protein [bacterium]
MKPTIERGAAQAKAARLLALHHDSPPLVLANAWDVASARLIEAAGFPAVATTSSGVANALGYPDGEFIGRDEMLAVVERIAAAVAVPVTADMEAGYGPAASDVAETVRRTIAAGAVGINLEDARRDGLLPLPEASMRISAARSAADAEGVHLVINARTDVFLLGGRGEEAFAEAVRRVNAYRQAGADSLFVPAVADGVLIGRLAKAISGPLNVLAGPATPPLPELARLGVARVSVGGSLARAALTVVRRVAEELQGPGTFTFAAGIITHAEMSDLLRAAM